MVKTIAAILISSVVFTLLLASCSKTNTEEPTTDYADRVIAAIDKSTPVTQGNLITKTETDADGNLNINYYNSDGNLVENFIWTETENISHSLMTYSETDKLLQKEYLSPQGITASVESYVYDTADNLEKKTVNVYEDGKNKTSTTYDANDNVINSSSYSYNDSELLTKIEIFDKNNKLSEYFCYEYNDKYQNVKYSAYGADSTLKKYTTFEYNDAGLTTTERNFDGSDNLLDYYTMEYSDNNELVASRHFDSQGNLTSEDIYIPQ